MVRIVIVCILNGFLFGVLDGIIHANPYAKRLFAVYKPIARESINVPSGVIIDIAYGFIMGFFFLLLYKALPGEAGIIKGLSFGLIIWFFRVMMNVVSTWVMHKVPVSTLLYITFTGLIELIILGIVYGLFLKPGIF